MRRLLSTIGKRLATLNSRLSARAVWPLLLIAFGGWKLFVGVLALLCAGMILLAVFETVVDLYIESADSIFRDRRSRVVPFLKKSPYEIR